MSFYLFDEEEKLQRKRYYSSSATSTSTSPPEGDENKASNYSNIGDEASVFLKSQDDENSSFYDNSSKTNTKNGSSSVTEGLVAATSPEALPALQIAKKIANHKNSILVGGGGLSLVIIGIIILFFLGSQKLPGFAALIASQSMASANRAFERDTTELTSEKAALDSEGVTDGNLATVESTFSDTATGGLLSRIKSYSPNSVVDNLKSSDIIKLNYGPVESGLGKYLGADELKSISVGNQDFLASDVAPSAWDTLLHPVQSLGNRASSVSNLMDSLGELDINGGLLVRFGVARQLISSLGGDALAGL
ncbi:MAG TPA: hypothetical protein VII94_04010, partial [Candidatus Saccharimonadales bacterium]